MTKTTTDYYEAMRADGEAYEDRVYRLLYERCGWDVIPHVGRAQQRMGENRAGIEVKLDRNMHRTSNVYLEVAEKTYAHSGSYVASGLNRRDNTWLWAIGNWDETLIFGRTQLVTWVREKEWRKVQKETSIGYLMPLSFARQHAELRLR